MTWITLNPPVTAGRGAAMSAARYAARWTVVLVASVLCPTVNAQHTAPASRPNILFVFSDDHAQHAIGAYGGRLAELDPTPHIDRLAREGMRFDASFCTNSICGPSRASILTGKHSHANGFRVNGDRFDGDQVTFPKLLQAAGYQTAIVGKWHLSSDPQGFDHWEVLPGQGRYYNPRLLRDGGERVVEGHSTAVVTDLALQWLDERDPERPFLLMCQYKAPHRNWMPAPEHLDLYDDVTIPEPASLFDSHSDNASPARHQEMEIDRHLNLAYDLFVTPRDGYDPDSEPGSDRSGWRNLDLMTPVQRAAWDAAFDDENSAFWATDKSAADIVRWKYQRYLKNYLRCVRGVDDGVGRLLEHLDATGLADDTIVIYCSDQGFYLGDHGWYDKRWMYEESLSMPLIVRWPGVVDAGTVTHHLVQNIDYAATFLDVAGAPVPDDVQGRSLLPLLRGDLTGNWRDAIYYHYYEYPSVHMVARHDGIRTERYKLIHFYQFDEWELYDLEDDPDERRNLHGLEGYGTLTDSLARQLRALREHYAVDADLSPMPAEWRAQYR